MTSVTVTVDPMSTLPIYLIIMTGAVLAVAASAAQRGLYALADRNPGSGVCQFLGSRLGSTVLLMALCLGLMTASVLVLVPSY